MAARAWTERDKKRQAAVIRRQKPWRASTGPKTPAGKARSSRNAVKPGILPRHDQRLLAKYIKIHKKIYGLTKLYIRLRRQEKFLQIPQNKLLARIVLVCHDLDRQADRVLDELADSPVKAQIPQNEVLAPQLSILNGNDKNPKKTPMTYTVKGDTGDWEVVIGMEVHAQIIAKSKLFSGASSEFGGAPNDHVSVVDAAMPGMLPVLNEYCVEQAVRTGLGLKAKINNTSVFERKNYFYPDLPQGYQISQFLHPIVGKGEIEIDLTDGSVKKIGITRLHLEQDAGKSLHDQHPTKSYVDLNRSGCALMEIVSEPDIRGPDEATAYLSKLRMILRYLGTCDGNMEEGSMRADVNVSVRKPGDKLGTRCEIKNVNSVKAVQMAIEYEAARQVEIIEGGGTIRQETRLWNPDKGVTKSMRSKEEAHDYRYFPDPDLLPLHVANDWIQKIKETLPELPDDKRNRFMKDYGLTAYDANVLIAEKSRADYFEEAAKGSDAKLTANWVINELLGILNKNEKTLEQSPIKARQIGALVGLITNNTISGKIAKDVFADMYATSEDPAKIVEKKGLKQVTDTGAIEKIVDEVIAENPQIVADYKGGNEKVFGFLVGQTMKKSQGKASPGMVNELLKKKLQ